jgi:hypothetical protein
LVCLLKARTLGNSVRVAFEFRSIGL